MAEDDKSEDATPTKLEQARNRGDVAQSREFANFVVFLGFAVTMYFTSRNLLQQTVTLLKKYLNLEAFHQDSPDEFHLIWNSVMHEILQMIIPMFIGVFVFGMAAYVVQFGFIFSADKLMPDFDKIDPMNGLKKIFSKDTGLELVRSVIKIVVISWVLYLVLRGEFQHLSQIGVEPMGRIFLYFVQILAKVLFVMLIFSATLGLVDLGYQKWSYAQKMRMTFQEVKDEMKQREGDPQIRSRIRQIQRERARQRMMEEVPHADVVVTNPTHVAIALKYERGKMRAPVVVAKGAGFIALKIKEIAAKAQVPILERKELARYIYRHVEINHPIPETLYTAVAEVLAYVYKIKKRFRDLVRKGRA